LQTETPRNSEQYRLHYKPMLSINSLQHQNHLDQEDQRQNLYPQRREVDGREQPPRNAFISRKQCMKSPHRDHLRYAYQGIGSDNPTPECRQSLEHGLLLSLTKCEREKNVWIVKLAG
jgi:hypothetical protein